MTEFVSVPMLISIVPHKGAGVPYQFSTSREESKAPTQRTLERVLGSFPGVGGGGCSSQVGFLVVLLSVRSPSMVEQLLSFGHLQKDGGAPYNRISRCFGLRLPFSMMGTSRSRGLCACGMTWVQEQNPLSNRVSKSMIAADSPRPRSLPGSSGKTPPKVHMGMSHPK